MNLLHKAARKIQYIQNTKAAYDFEPQRGGWQKYPEPVFGDETTGSVFDPFVIRTDSGYRMFVSERKRDGILCVDSSDGIRWKRGVAALLSDPDSGWEDKVNRATIVRSSSQWLMWYTGQNATHSSIGIAVSDDGIRYRRIRKEPVLVADQPCEKQSVMNPCVIWDEAAQKYKMWYAAGEKYEPDVLCYAESTDGVNWKKHPANPVLSKSGQVYDRDKVGGCDVKRVGGKYIMYYIGYQNVDVARICVAESADGVGGWTRIKDNPIIGPTKGGWDASAVYKPSVIYNDPAGKVMLWYNGRNKQIESIGLAYKKDVEYGKHNNSGL